MRAGTGGVRGRDPVPNGTPGCRRARTRTTGRGGAGAATPAAAPARAAEVSGGNGSGRALQAPPRPQVRGADPAARAARSRHPGEPCGRSGNRQSRARPVPSSRGPLAPRPGPSTTLLPRRQHPRPARRSRPPGRPPAPAGRPRLTSSRRRGQGRNNSARRPRLSRRRRCAAGPVPFTPRPPEPRQGGGSGAEGAEREGRRALAGRGEGGAGGGGSRGPRGEVRRARARQGPSALVRAPEGGGAHGRAWQRTGRGRLETTRRAWVVRIRARTGELGAIVFLLTKLAPLLSVMLCPPQARHVKEYELFSVPFSRCRGLVRRSLVGGFGGARGRRKREIICGGEQESAQHCLVCMKKKRCPHLHLLILWGNKARRTK